MNNILLKKLVLISAICAAGAILILTVNKPSYAENIKNKSRLNFYVPDDWPIEKRGGILAPIPTEEYITIKFTEVEGEFLAIKDDLVSKLEELQLSIKNMETNFTKEIHEAQLQTDAQSGAGEDLTDILPRLGLLESELGRLDRKITNKASIIKTQSQEMAVIVSSFEKKIKEFQTQIYKLEETIDYLMDQQGDSY